MISLKKHIDDWNTTGPNPPLNAYRSLLLTIGKCSHRAVPGLGRALEQKLSEMNAELEAALPSPEFANIFATSQQNAQLEISRWADEALLRHKSNEKELRDIIEAMANAVESITQRDERYKMEVGDLTARLRSLTALSDLALVRRSIVESADSLTACVERMVETGRESVQRLKAEVEEYRSRLDKSVRIALLDPLTGLANRRRFEEQLKGKIQARARFCLILADIDGFKEVNDRLGHLAGDEVLKSFAVKLRQLFPSADLIARWGGDEFAVIINSTRNDAEARVDRIRRSSIGDLRIKTGKQTVSVAVEASFGVVEWNGSEDGADLVARADNSTYLRKNSNKAVRVG